jgi:hypothetical protein
LERNLEVLAAGSNDLAKGNSAVVRRDALMPVGAKAAGAQAGDGALGEVTILKTTT